MLGNLVLATALCLAQANAPKTTSTPPETPSEPKAVLTCPDKRDLGKTIIVKTTGSVGKDFKFKVTPAVADSFTVKDADSGEYILLFTPETAGIYTVVLGVAQGDKISIDAHQVTVGNYVPPTPTPTPTPTPNQDLINYLAPLYKSDLAAGVGTAAQKKLLSLCYKNGASTAINPSLTKVQDIYDTMRAALKQLQMPDAALPQLRNGIAEWQKKNLNLNVSSPLNDPTRQSIATAFTSIYQALEAIPE